MTAWEREREIRRVKQEIAFLKEQIARANMAPGDRELAESAHRGDPIEAPARRYWDPAPLRRVNSTAEFRETCESIELGEGAELDRGVRTGRQGPQRLQSQRYIGGF